MNNQPLPYDLARRWASLPDLSYRGGNEWSSSCPQCGGGGRRHDKSDRFRLFAAGDGRNGRVWCRQCGYFAWADDDQKPPSREEMEAANRERARLAGVERERIKQKIKQIEQAAYWKGWHDSMSQQQRELWRQEGIPDFMIDYYSLGYVTDHTYYHDGNQWHSPALTIPHYEAGWQLSNIQYRLLEPTAGAGKYRQTAGLPAAMFLTEPEEPLNRPVLIVEGAKKAMIAYAHLGGKEFATVAVPSKTPTEEMLARVAECETVYICLDPDAYVPTRTADGRVMAPAVNRIVKQVGRERARLVRLPCKPDDLFTKYRGGAGDMAAYIKMAAKV